MHMLRDAINLLEGLTLLHDRAFLVHRDIKAANITYANRHVRMLDYGLSVDIHSSQSLEELLDSVDNIHFELWSIDINTRCTKLRTADCIGAWMANPKVRRWCMWFDYCRVTNPNPSHDMKVDITESAQLAKAGSDSKEQKTKADENEWYAKYINQCCSFWNECDVLTQATPSSDATEQQKLKVLKEDRAGIIRQMLKQNDVLSLGLMICNFIFNQYIRYHQRKQLDIPDPKELAEWIQTVLIPMIQPHFASRITSKEAHRRSMIIFQTLDTRLSKGLFKHHGPGTNYTSNSKLDNKIDTPMVNENASVGTGSTTLPKQTCSVVAHSVSQSHSFSGYSCSTASRLRHENEQTVFSPPYKKARG
jgi:serine/threonine protein kinase